MTTFEIIIVSVVVAYVAVSILIAVLFNMANKFKKARKGRKHDEVSEV